MLGTWFGKKPVPDAVHVSKVDYRTDIFKFSYRGFFHLYTFRNWERNRKPDMTRVQDMVTDLDSSDRSVTQGIVYAWKRPDSDELVIYDGMHRLLASYMCQRQMDVIVSLCVTDDEDVILQDFRRINKSVSVPFLYIDEDVGAAKTMVCEAVTERLCTEYGAFASPSRRHYPYNFNKDMFLDWIATLELDWTTDDLATKIWQELLGLNHVAKDYCVQNRVTCPKKCAFHSFWLFYLSKDTLKSELERRL